MIHSLVIAGLLAGVAGPVCAMQESTQYSIPAKALLARSSMGFSESNSIIRSFYNGCNNTGSAIARSSYSIAESIKSMASVAGKGVSYSAKGLKYSLIDHPVITGTTLAGITGFYLYTCRKNARDFTPEITDAKQETAALDVTSRSPDTQRSLYRHWNLKPGSASKIAHNWQIAYTDLKRDFAPYEDKQTFITNTIRKIDGEKNELKKLYGKIDKCFAAGTLLPRMRGYSQICDNPVLVLVNNYLKEQNKNHFYELSQLEVAYLEKEIQKMISFSVFSLLSFKPWKTFNWHRLYAIPYEADAIEQYWKLYQMMSHLDALQYCLREALKDNNLH